jgi:hypothetical protein
MKELNQLNWTGSKSLSSSLLLYYIALLAYVFRASWQCIMKLDMNLLHPD